MPSPEVENTAVRPRIDRESGKTYTVVLVRYDEQEDTVAPGFAQAVRSMLLSPPLDLRLVEPALRLDAETLRRCLRRLRPGGVPALVRVRQACV